MKSAKIITKVVCVFLAIVTIVSSCKKFSTLNTDPNNPTTANASPDYLMAGVLTSTAKWYGDLGSGMISGNMQQTYQDAFGGSASDYDWTDGTKDWSVNYSTLNNNKLCLEKAQEFGWNFHQGVSLIMRAFNYGNIADFWGPAPDSMALSGDQGGVQFIQPVYDSQDTLYMRVIADLKAALPLLTGSMSDHPEISSLTQSSDPLYAGDPVKWTKFANTLLLRYYLRLSAKMDVQAAVEAVAANVFQSNADDCAMPFPGIDQNSSYQFCSFFNGGSGFQRNKMCGTMTMRMRDLKDPRIVIMAEPIAVPSVVDGTKFAPGDTTVFSGIINGVRYINSLSVTSNNSEKWKQFDPKTYSADRPFGAPDNGSLWNLYDTSSVYVGIPISYANYVDFLYNHSQGTQSTSTSSYVSYLRRDIYDQVNGPLLNEKLASYAEVCFDLAEAAQKGWSVGGSDEDWYYKGIQASFDNWQVFSTYQSDVNGYYGCVKDYNSYIAQDSVAYDGTLARIMEQKWIAAWQTCNEAYMDWRRTGLPSFIQIGYFSKRGAIPLRFAVQSSEIASNGNNSAAAFNQLTPTAYNAGDGNNSPWSKFWLLQGTGKPW